MTNSTINRIANTIRTAGNLTARDLADTRNYLRDAYRAADVMLSDGTRGADDTMAACIDLENALDAR